VGVDIALAAPPAGNVSTAAGRITDTGIKAAGRADDVVLFKLDVHNHEDAHVQLVAVHITCITKETG
jgi:hypothetical protein